MRLPTRIALKVLVMGLVIVCGGLGAAVAEPLPARGVSLPGSEVFISVAKKAQASVVNISSVRKVEAGAEGFEFPSPFFDDPFFRRFFGEEFERRFQVPREFRQEGLGSGVIVSADGYIVTNTHVVEQAEEIEVLLADKRKFKAKLVGTDPRTDVAVIKIEATGLPTLPWGNSSLLQVGELVLAIGSPFGLTQTVTMGIISAVGRADVGIVDYEDFIQTDAAINPGNSGGALVNLAGELIGINTAIFTRTGGYMGIGFAIPSNMAKSVMQSLIKHGKVIRGWLGVSIQEVTEELAKQFGAPDRTGALVADVMENSPAEKGGLKRGDIVTHFKETKIKDPTHLRTLVAETEPGTRVVVTVLRDEQSMKLTVELGEMPKEAEVPGKPGEAAPGDHALSGVAVELLSSQDTKRLKIPGGVFVTEVDPGSAAGMAGLRPGDVIREINRKAIRTVDEFVRLTGELGPKEPVLILITRGRSTIFMTIQP